MRTLWATWPSFIDFLVVSDFIFCGPQGGGAPPPANDSTVDSTLLHIAAVPRTLVADAALAHVLSDLQAWLLKLQLAPTCISEACANLMVALPGLLHPHKKGSSPPRLAARRGARRDNDDPFLCMALCERTPTKRGHLLAASCEKRPSLGARRDNDPFLWG